MFVDGSFYPVNGVSNSSLGTGVAEPPYVMADEARLLGSILTKPKLWAVTERLEAADFSRAHGRIFEAMKVSVECSREPNMANTLNALHDAGRVEEVGGSAAVTRLYQSVEVLTERQLIEFVSRIQKASIARTAIAQMHKAVAELQHTPQHVAEHVAQLRHGLETLRVSETQRVDSIDDILNHTAEIPYVIPSLSIGPGDPTLFVGYSHSGKTMVLQDLALSLASGKPVWGVHNCKKSRVLHLSYDQGRDITLDRYQRMVRARCLQREALTGLHVECRPDLYLNEKKGTLSLRKRLEAYDVCIVDALLSSMPGLDENDSKIRKYIDELGRISEATGCAILVIHHAGKGSKDAKSENKLFHARGSSSIIDACDNLFFLTGGEGKEDPVFVEQAKNRSQGDKSKFYLQFANRDGGIHVTHLEVEQVDRMADEAEESDQDKVLAYLRRHSGKFPGSQLGLYKSMVKDKTGLRKSAFYEAVKSLSGLGRIKLQTRGELTVSIV